MKKYQYPKFQVPKAVIHKLFEPNNFFHCCNKYHILYKGARYYIGKSDDGKSLLLVQVLDKEHITLASIVWDKPYDSTTNPWLTMKGSEHSESLCHVHSNISSEKSHERFRKHGMNSGWTRCNHSI